jgi:hypothetical protein
MHQIAPVPNLNGSPADDLAKQMMEVCHALEEAATLMMRWQPHGRDYQIGGDYQADRTEYLRRIGIVEALSRQYEREAIAVSEYNHKKARVG